MASIPPSAAAARRAAVIAGPGVGLRIYTASSCASGCDPPRVTARRAPLEDIARSAPRQAARRSLLNGWMMTEPIFLWCGKQPSGSILDDSIPLGYHCPALAPIPALLLR